MDRETLIANLDRLAGLRGDVSKGVSPAAWASALKGVDDGLLMRAAIEAVRELLLPDWAGQRPDDLRPQQALEAAQAWLDSPSAEAAAHAKATAKACTAARGETFGTHHRVPEAARAVAWATGTKGVAHLHDAYVCIEEELLARIALRAEYHLALSQREAIVRVLRRVLVSEATPAPAEQTAAAPYSPAGSFAVGQRIAHSKFGDLVVTSATDTQIEVEQGDGTKRRLAHRRV